jgi:SAM-dependent methyltransferase
LSQWDERFASPQYVYGTEPNRWLALQAAGLPTGGRVLSLGEGEGRNAVWLAQQGFHVTAVDGSAVGLAKARRLAAERGVGIETEVADLARWEPELSAFDAVVLVFAHLPPAVRSRVHAAAQRALRPDGQVILEAFTPRQLGFTSGGPRDAAMLYEPDGLRSDFPGVVWDVLAEERVELDEGPLHRGPAAVVHGVGRRVA